MTKSVALRGSPPWKPRRPSPAYARGRVCAQEGCSTELSIYNKAAYCWAHAPLRFPHIRGRRRRKTAA